MAVEAMLERTGIGEWHGHAMGVQPSAAMDGATRIATHSPGMAAWGLAESPGKIS